MDAAERETSLRARDTQSRRGTHLHRPTRNVRTGVHPTGESDHPGVRLTAIVCGVDPVDDPEFNIHTYREPNPVTIAEIRALAAQWRAAVEAANDIRAELNAAIIRAKNSGHSYSQLREATKMGTQTIQMILAKAAYEEERGGQPPMHGAT